MTAEEMRKQQEMDLLLSEAMNTLTFEERQEQQEVLHGVEQEIAEECIIIETALKELDNHLIRIKHGTVYEKAETMNPEYVHARAFRIMFLRGNRYDTKASADQMLKFFAQKEKLFGTEKLVQDITLEDFDEDDMAVMNAGSIQLAGRDRSNRQIVFASPGLRLKGKPLRSELRTRYYMCMSGLESQETQLKGAVNVAYAVGAYKDKNEGGGYLEHTYLAMSLPIHWASNHFVCSDISQHLVGSVAVAAMPAKLRSRFRIHLGSHLECLYLLSTYGILPQLLPFSSNSDEITFASHLHWVQLRVASSNSAEQFKSNETMTSSTSINDVLYIGGKKSNNAGNQRLRVLVKELAQVYDTGTNEKKRTVVDAMINQVTKNGGRFLKQVKDSNAQWEILSLDDSRAKITQAFRNHRRRPDESKKGGTSFIQDDPMPDDVIFGKSQRSRGNDLLTHLIKNRAEEYDSLDRGMKVKVVDAIVHRIKSEGGRFLQPTPEFGGWLEVSNEMARSRISKYFRNNRRPSTKKNNA
ncbi:unnamed protein product [Cylindrotheca closterium]|uniref:DUF6824 domain-containing protein n=1 Tax=Cylindrotheca closterium TaxID=2856 RepID=A0AAD2CPV9_9STRA|nr:unnamed protein product [Cylindrotheca closterium]